MRAQEVPEQSESILSSYFIIIITMLSSDNKYVSLSLSLSLSLPFKSEMVAADFRENARRSSGEINTPAIF